MPETLENLAAEALEGCIATRLRLATRVITKIYEDALRPHGVTTSQMGLLAVAGARGIIRQTDVISLLRLDDSTLSRNLERMRANGWLEEVVEADARVHTHRLTAEGAVLLKRIMPAWRDAQRQAGELLGATAVHSLQRFAMQQGLGD